MPRPKKEGKNISFYMDAEIVDRLHDYAEDKGQTLTAAAERIIKEALDKYDGNYVVSKPVDEKKVEQIITELFDKLDRQNKVREKSNSE